jgi:hypothetical protein
MSSDKGDDKILEKLISLVKTDTSNYIVLKREKHIRNSNEALKYERQIMKFADALIITVQELDNAVLNALKGNPNMSINELVDVTQSEFFKVEQSIARLIEKGLLEDNKKGFKPTEKALEKKTEPIESDEIYTVYKYEVNEDKPSLLPGGKSREFCSKLITKMRNPKNYLEFEDIDSMTNDLGTNVWDYRGGYFYNRDTATTDPDCRHLWMAETRLRKKEKK